MARLDWLKAAKAYGLDRNKKTRTALQAAYDALHGELDKSIRHVTNGTGTLLVPSGKYWKLTKHPKGIQIEVTDQPAARGLLVLILSPLNSDVSPRRSVEDGGA